MDRILPESGSTVATMDTQHPHPDNVNFFRVFPLPASHFYPSMTGHGSRRRRFSSDDQMLSVPVIDRRLWRQKKRHGEGGLGAKPPLPPTTTSIGPPSDSRPHASKAFFQRWQPAKGPTEVDCGFLQPQFSAADHSCRMSWLILASNQHQWLQGSDNHPVTQHSAKVAGALESRQKLGSCALAHRQRPPATFAEGSNCYCSIL